jgi:hypothetical protein
MMRWFDKLNLGPSERRIAIAGACLFALLLNYWLIWPYFSEWGQVEREWDKLTGQKAIYFKEVSQKAAYQRRLTELEGSGAQVMPEDQANTVQSSIVAAAGTNGVNIIQITPQLATLRTSASKDTNFFDEQVVVVNLSAKEQGLVSFLHALGSSDSMIRVREMSRLRLDNSGQNLGANVTFVASFQKANKPNKSTPPKPASGSTNLPPAAPGAKGLPDASGVKGTPGDPRSKASVTNATSKK